MEFPKSKEDLNSTPEYRIELAIDTIDFSLLREILSNLARKVGAREKFRFTERSAIKVITDAEFGGSNNHKSGEIILNASFLDENSRATKLSLELMTLWVLCHEEAHGLSRHTADQKEGVWHQNLGYQKLIGNTREEIEGTGWFFDEGVTEKIGRDVLVEYLKRTDPASQALVEEIAARNVHPYDSSVRLTNAFVGRIARLGGVSEKTAWEAVMNGFMSEGDPFDQELGTLAKDILPEKIFDDLRSVKGPSRLNLPFEPQVMKIKKIIHELESDKPKQNIVDKIKSWLSKWIH